MTQEKERSEIIRMANEAGLCDSIWVDEESSAVNSVIYFAQLVAANAAAVEREELASEAEKNGNTILAMQIRARGQQ